MSSPKPPPETVQRESKRQQAALLSAERFYSESDFYRFYSTKSRPTHLNTNELEDFSLFPLCFLSPSKPHVKNASCAATDQLFEFAKNSCQSVAGKMSWIVSKLKSVRNFMQTADSPKKHNIAMPITIWPSDLIPRQSKINTRIHTIETLKASWKRILPSWEFEAPESRWRTTPLK